MIVLRNRSFSAHSLTFWLGIGSIPGPFVLLSSRPFLISGGFTMFALLLWYWLLTGLITAVLAIRRTRQGDWQQHAMSFMLGLIFGPMFVLVVISLFLLFGGLTPTADAQGNSRHPRVNDA